MVEPAYMRCQEKVLNSREFGAGGFARWWTQITIERQIIQKGAKWAYEPGSVVDDHLSTNAVTGAL
jgi:hypothetical protein